MKFRFRFKLRTLFIVVTLAAVFLYWAKLQTFQISTQHFYFYWQPRGFVNVCAYDWQGNSVVLLQVWPKGYKYPFAIVKEQDKLWIQFAHTPPQIYYYP